MKPINEDDFFGSIRLTKGEIKSIVKYINFNYETNVDAIDVDEVIPVYIDKSAGPRVFEVRYKAHQVITLDEDDLLKIIGRK